MARELALKKYQQLKDRGVEAEEILEFILNNHLSGSDAEEAIDEFISKDRADFDEDDDIDED